MPALRYISLMLLITLAGGCGHYGLFAKRESELNCPTDIRKTVPWCAGEDAIFRCPCGPRREFYGHKPTCWGTWPLPGAQWRDAFCPPVEPVYMELEEMPIEADAPEMMSLPLVNPPSQPSPTTPPAEEPTELPPGLPAEQPAELPTELPEPPETQLQDPSVPAPATADPAVHTEEVAIDLPSPAPEISPAPPANALRRSNPFR